MEEDIKHYKLGNTIQEFEEVFGNIPFDDIDKIKKYLIQNYIPNSKIKEKKENKIKSINDIRSSLYMNREKFDEIKRLEIEIELLQELIGG